MAENRAEYDGKTQLITESNQDIRDQLADIHAELHDLRLTLCKEMGAESKITRDQIVIIQDQLRALFALIDEWRPVLEQFRAPAAASLAAWRSRRQDRKNGGEQP